MSSWKIPYDPDCVYLLLLLVRRGLVKDISQNKGQQKFSLYSKERRAFHTSYRNGRSQHPSNIWDWLRKCQFAVYKEHGYWLQQKKGPCDNEYIQLTWGWYSKGSSCIWRCIHAGNLWSKYGPFWKLRNHFGVLSTNIVSVTTPYAILTSFYSCL